MTALTSAGLVPLARIRGLSGSSSRGWCCSAGVVLRDEREPDQSPPRLARYAEFQNGFVAATVRGPRRGSRSRAAARGSAADCGDVQPLAVDGDLELVSLAARARDFELDRVIAVHRER